jgi:phosphohistidine phosphatase SixA
MAIRHVLAGMVLLAAGCATARDEAPAKQVYVMRHLQAGSGQDPGLSEDGARQARLLAEWFSGKAAPSAIYTSSFRRARETAAPLAARLGVTPKLYDPASTDALVASVAGEAGSVLVVGHSNTVPDIVERLGGARPQPIQHDQHGDIWIVSGAGNVERAKLEAKAP